MRKIRRISHLKTERRRLQQRQAELERNIRSDWALIRRTLEPEGLAREALHSTTNWLGRQLLTRLTGRKKPIK